jgi:uncharacterized membrane protein
METPSSAAEGVVAPGWFDSALHWIALWFEAAGVGVIVLGAVFAVALVGRQAVRGDDWSETYHLFRTRLARGILEFLVAADIIGTVAVDPTLQNLSVLGLIVLIRTFLSFALELEISGRWPWQKAPWNDNQPGGGSERQ